MKGKYVWMILIVFLSCVCKAQEDIIANFEVGDSIFNLVLKKYNYSDAPSYSALYAGHEYLSGHFYVPGELDTCIIVGCEIEYDTEHTSIRTLLEYEAQKYTSEYVFFTDSCVYKDYEDSVFNSQRYYNGFMEYFFNPLNLISDVMRYKNTLHFFNTTNDYHIVGYNDCIGNKYFVYVNKSDFSIFQIVRYYNDLNYGDTFDKIIYKNDSCISLIPPIEIQYYVGRNIRKHILLKSVLNSNYNAIKPSRNNEIFAIETISDNCFLVKILTQDNKVLIYKQNSNISVFEAPINPIVSNQLIDYLSECFPDAPVKYCFLTHHHPDHAGGVKSFKEIDAVVVAPAGDVDYISRLANYPFKIKGIYDKHTAVKFDVVKNDSIKCFFDGKIIAYEIGRETAHAENFIVYYLPEEDILFSSDLLFLPDTGIINQRQRAYSIYNLIAKNHLPTKRLKIIPSYPLVDYKDYGTFYDLIDCLRKNYPDLNSRFFKQTE
jgi:hypothetical protein